MATLGGLLFGYDTGVVNGSIKFVQLKFALDPAMKGWAASSALLACMFGAAFAGPLSDRFGRKKVLVLSAVLFLVSAVGTALPRSITQFIAFRFIGGLGVGAAIIHCEERGKLVPPSEVDCSRAVVFGEVGVRPRCVASMPPAELREMIWIPLACLECSTGRIRIPSRTGGRGTKGARGAGE